MRTDLTVSAVAAELDGEVIDVGGGSVHIRFRATPVDWFDAALIGNPVIDLAVVYRRTDDGTLHRGWVRLSDHGGDVDAVCQAACAMTLIPSLWG